MATDTVTDGRWSASQACDWYARLPWLCGFNFMPSSAVNFLEMWHRDTFDPDTIRRELSWAADAGYNALRTNPQFLIWRHDRDGLIERFETLLDIAAGLKLGVVPCLFDDCEFSGADPVYGPQPDPVPGLHNSRAVGSPGRAVVAGGRLRNELESYVTGMIGPFATDERILFWDLYNEPGNRYVFSHAGFSEADSPDDARCAALMRNSFRWAHAVRPSQPLTVGAWQTPDAWHPGAALFDDPLDLEALALSDVVTFHAYVTPERMARLIAALRRFDRPIICTEWMARALGSDIPGTLPLLATERVGAFQWGLVAGRSQTNLPWPEPVIERNGGRVGAEQWFHDVFYSDGTAFDLTEMRTIRSHSGDNWPSRRAL